jgi:uncharacterized membrane protein (UPF0127 family)
MNVNELPIVTLPIGKNKYFLYVADTEERKYQGLSGVKSLPKNTGMLFPYDEERPRTFQFRDTLLPLTVYFIGSDGKILQKSNSKPGGPSIHCSKPCKYVIEVPSGV